MHEFYCIFSRIPVILVILCMSFNIHLTKIKKKTFIISYKKAKNSFLSETLHNVTEVKVKKKKM